MPIYREVETSSYTQVRIENKEIIEDLERKDALEVVIGLLKKFPDLTKEISLKEEKLFPKHLSDVFIMKYRSENKNIENFAKME